MSTSCLFFIIQPFFTVVQTFPEPSKSFTIDIVRAIKEAIILGFFRAPIYIENDEPRQPLIVEARSNLGIVAVRGDGINPRLREVLEQRLPRSKSSAVSFHAW